MTFLYLMFAVNYIRILMKKKTLNKVYLSNDYLILCILYDEFEIQKFEKINLIVGVFKSDCVNHGFRSIMNNSSFKNILKIEVFEVKFV
jgi:hypothetical protein